MFCQFCKTFYIPGTNQTTDIDTFHPRENHHTTTLQPVDHGNAIVRYCPDEEEDGPKNQPNQHIQPNCFYGGSGENVPKIDISTGQTLGMENLGPIIVNVDGSLSRIGNWGNMTENEKETAKRLIGARNIRRLTQLAEQKNLNQADLVSALLK